MSKLLFIFMIFCSVQAMGQEMDVKSFYPASAFVVNRMLPFEVTGTENMKIKSIVVSDGKSCQSLVDPFHSHIFHIFCTRPEVIDVAVTVEHDLDSFDYILTFNNVSIVEQRVPGEELNSVNRVDPFAEETN